MTSKTEQDIEKEMQGCGKEFDFDYTYEIPIKCGDGFNGKTLYCPKCEAKLEGFKLGQKETADKKDAEIFGLGNALKDFKEENRKLKRQLIKLIKKDAEWKRKIEDEMNKFLRYVVLKDEGTGGEESWIYVSENNSDLEKLKKNLLSENQEENKKEIGGK
jgi:hypothetical protein